MSAPRPVVTYAGFWIRTVAGFLDLLFILLVFAIFAGLNHFVLDGELGLFPYYEVAKQDVYDARWQNEAYGESFVVKSYEKRIDPAGRQKEVLILNKYGQLPLPFEVMYISSFEAVVSEDVNWGGRYALAFNIVANMVTAAYFVLMWRSRWQATLGGKILSLRVVDEFGSRITWKRALWRMLACLVSGFTIIGFLMIAFTKRKQGLHDKMARTMVLEKAK